MSAPPDSSKLVQPLVSYMIAHTFHGMFLENEIMLLFTPWLTMYFHSFYSFIISVKHEGGKFAIAFMKSIGILCVCDCKIWRNFCLCSVCFYDGYMIWIKECTTTCISLPFAGAWFSSSDIECSADLSVRTHMFQILVCVYSLQVILYLTKTAACLLLWKLSLV